MTRTKKLIFTFLTVFFVTVVQAFAQQQITKFAVVDTSKVYSAYYKNSQPVRTYEAKKNELQAEVTKRADEIKELKRKKAECDKNGDTAQSQKLQADITKKTEYLKEYTNAKNAELDTMLANLKRSDDFYQQLYKALAKVAESNGYSMILSLQDANAILWYSPAVDVTNLVISELKL